MEKKEGVILGSLPGGQAGVVVPGWFSVWLCCVLLHKPSPEPLLLGPLAWGLSWGGGPGWGSHHALEGSWGSQDVPGIGLYHLYMD